MREFYFPKWLFGAHSIQIECKFAHSIQEYCPKTGLLTQKCAFYCNFNKVRTQFKLRIVLKRIRYTIVSTLSPLYMYVFVGFLPVFWFGISGRHIGEIWLPKLNSSFTWSNAKLYSIVLFPVYNGWMITRSTFLSWCRCNSLLLVRSQSPHRTTRWDNWICLWKKNPLKK